jgi:hypothetical protein
MKFDKSIFFAIYLLFGAYLMNKFFVFWKIPESFLNYESVIFLIAGVFLIFSSVSFLKRRQNRFNRSR